MLRKPYLTDQSPGSSCLDTQRSEDLGNKSPVWLSMTIGSNKATT